MYSGGTAREREEIMERRDWERKMIKAGVFTREEIINARIQDARVFENYSGIECHDSSQLWKKDVRCFTPYLYRGNEYSLKKELKEFHPMWRYHIIATGKNKMALKVQFFPL